MKTIIKGHSKLSGLNWTPKGDYFEALVGPQLLRPLFQKKYLDKFMVNIAAVNYEEELKAEQTIMEDNLGRTDLILIDRQVTDTKLDRRRMDILGLRRLSGNAYSFVVIEVKLGTNPELQDKVASQISHYQKHIDKWFSDYKNCYELHYSQQLDLGLLGSHFPPAISLLLPSFTSSTWKWY